MREKEREKGKKRERVIDAKSLQQIMAVNSTLKGSTHMHHVICDNTTCIIIILSTGNNAACKKE